jgi:hypothetical protein
MAKQFKNKGKLWSRMDLVNLRQHIAHGLPTSIIAQRLQRTVASVQSKAITLGFRISSKT